MITITAQAEYYHGEGHNDRATEVTVTVPIEQLGQAIEALLRAGFSLIWVKNGA